MHLDDRVTIATPEGVTLELVLAGLGSRFLARLLDTVIQVAIIIALAVGVDVVIGAPGWSCRRWHRRDRSSSCSRTTCRSRCSNDGRTIGKLAAGIRVVGRDGEPVGFLASAIRNILRIVDFLPVLLSRRHRSRSSRRSTTNASAISRPARSSSRDRFPGLAPRPPRADHRAARRGRDVGRLRGRRRRARKRCASSSTAASTLPLARPHATSPVELAGTGSGRRSPASPPNSPSRVRARGHRRRQAGPRVTQAYRERRARRHSSCAARDLRIAGGRARRGRRRCGRCLPVHPPLACPLRTAHRHPVPVLRHDARVSSPRCTATSRTSLAFNPGGVFVLALAVVALVRARSVSPAAASPVWLVLARARRAVVLEHRVQPDVPPTACWR